MESVTIARVPHHLRLLHLLANRALPIILLHHRFHQHKLHPRPGRQAIQQSQQRVDAGLCRLTVYVMLLIMKAFCLSRRGRWAGGSSSISKDVNGALLGSERRIPGSVEVRPRADSLKFNSSSYSSLSLVAIISKRERERQPHLRRAREE